jgi:hypothetical protein
MMNELPDVSPVLEQVFGPQYRADLRATLLARADETDDPAYADRLREAADGRRPLRSLLADPSFQSAVGLDGVAREELEGRSRTPEEREELARRFAAHREEHGDLVFPPVSELATYAADAAARSQRIRDVIAADELTGWQGSLERQQERRAAEARDGRNENPGGTTRG